MKIRFMHPAIGEFSVPLGTGRELIIGRAGVGVDIEITWDRRISRRHAKVWSEAGAVWFQDLGSRNGSWVGRTRQAGPVRLEPGSSVLLGETALLVPEDQSDREPRDVERTYESMPVSLEHPVGSVTETSLQLGEIVRSDEVQQTMDLHAMDSSDGLPMIEEPVEADPLPPQPLARWTSSGLVEVEVDRGQLQTLWHTELSKGGLYAHCDVPPDVGTPVEVRVRTPHGHLQFGAQVVSVVSAEQSAAFGMAPGTGLHVTGLTADKKQRLEDYAEGRSAALSSDAAEPDAPAAAAVEEALDRARRLLDEADKGALYHAIGSVPGASAEELRKALETRRGEFTTTLPVAAPPQAARLQAALTVLDRLERTLLNVDARLEYDFRAGHVRAEERMAAAAEHRGPTLLVLRRAWNRVAGKQVEASARLTRKAFAARQENDLPAAIEHGRQALQMNPFFDELVKTVVAWERLDAEAKAPKPRGRPKRRSSGLYGLADPSRR